jgi:hypothetical protein
MGVRFLLQTQAPGALMGLTLGLLVATAGLGYFALEAKFEAIRARREAIFRDEVLEAYKRTRGRIDPAFCCHWKGRQ